MNGKILLVDDGRAAKCLHSPHRSEHLYGCEKIIKQSFPV